MAISSAIFDNILTRLGSMYTIRVGSDTVGAYGDPEPSWTTYSGFGYVQVLNANDSMVRAGVLKVGDAQGYFLVSSPISYGCSVS